MTKGGNATAAAAAMIVPKAISTCVVDPEANYDTMRLQQGLHMMYLLGTLID